MARHFVGVDAATIATGYFQLSDVAVRDLATECAMGAIHGDAGLGKTFAVESALEAQALPSVWVTFGATASPKSVAQKLLYELTGIWHERDRFKLALDLIALLAEEPRVVVVDEAQWLNRACIEYLREIHDDRRTRFALLFVGGVGCWRVISRHPMLLSRIYRAVEFKRLTDAEVTAAMPAFHSIYEGADIETLLLVNDEFAHGCFRSWAVFTKTAADLCGRHDIGVLTQGVAEAALTLLPHEVRRAA